MDIRPIILTGRFVRLEPLSEDHISDLAQAGKDEAIWRYMRYGFVNSPPQMQAWVENLLRLQAQGTDLPFAVFHLADERVIGATRFLEIRSTDRALEVGGTWYGRPYWGSAVNPECKYLLFKHAFEVLGCVRVQLKTDLRNIHSQHAIERLGAVREGVLRNHMILPDGYRRFSVFYSILDEEWPAVKSSLEHRLAEFSPG